MGIQVFFMFPETRQKSLEEIDVLFENGVPAWKTRSGSRMEERALAYRQGRTRKKRSSDTTLQHDEQVEKASYQRMDRLA
jgi:hypothetical protein